MSEHDTLAVLTIIAGRYRVLREIGRGGMGAVHLVEHVNTGEQFALKVLLNHAGASPELVERFKREARAPARIKSDYVVKVIDADVAPELMGAPFLVMELLDGTSLEDQLYNHGALSPADTLEILGQLALALDRAHAMGIVHRDLKPDNIFLHQREGKRVVKLLDFGISKLMNEAVEVGNAGLTSTGAMLGTPLYMSPEQARGDVTIGPPTDIWSLGLIAFRMLTNLPYWDASSLAVLMSQIVALPLAAPTFISKKLPIAFDRWFYQSCDREPARRFPTVGKQIEALAAALNELGTRTQPLPSAPPAYGPPPLAPNTYSTTGGGIAHTRPGTSLPVPGPSRAPLFAFLLVPITLAVIGVIFGIRAFAPKPVPAASAAPPPAMSFIPPPVVSSVAVEPPPPPPSASSAPVAAPPAPKPVPRPAPAPPPAATTYAPRAL